MFARTERLFLRPGWAEDAGSLAAAIGDEAVLSKLARAPFPYRVSDAEDWLALEPREGEANFVIVARTEGAPRLVGGIGLHPDGEDLELGYWIARPYWGLGFATEAARAVVDIARHTLKRTKIVASHFMDNPASGRVLSKLGFRPTGEIVARMSRARGHAVPTKLFSLEFGDAGSGGCDADLPRMLAA